MTAGDIISKVDMLEPNQYSTTQKLEWLSTLDGKIIDQVIKTHQFFPGEFPHLHWPDPFDRDWRRWAVDPPPPPPPLYPIPMPQPPTDSDGKPIGPVPPPPPPGWPFPFPPPPPPPKEEEQATEEEPTTGEDQTSGEDQGATSVDDQTSGDTSGEEEEEEPVPPDPPKPKPPYTGPTDELIVKDPYGSEIYQHWLQAKIAEENAEIVKYNQQKMLFDAAYKEWTDYYNRTHMPKGARGGNRFRF